MNKSDIHLIELIKYVKHIFLIVCISLSVFQLPATNQVSQKKQKNIGAVKSGKYRNVFLEYGYKKSEIDKKIAKAYFDLFEGPDKVYFEVGDSMAYVSDIKNNDARTEGLSYGLMVAVQLNKKDVFDRIWRWTRKYLQHHGGSRDAYFAWSIEPVSLKHNSEGSASDGELYFITDLLFASNRWGNNTGINYYAEARKILDAMWSKDGTEGVRNLINVEQFYRDCADSARTFLHKACHPVTALNTDYTEFDGKPHTSRWMPAAFRYDSWRVPMNIAMDYAWFGKDNEWQQDYCRRIQGFFTNKGIDTFEDQFNVDGSRPEFILQAGGYKKLRHSLGLVSTLATTTIMGTKANSKKFIDALWNAKLERYEDGYFDPYFDGFLYLFSLMHLSGNYQAITPKTHLYVL